MNTQQINEQAISSLNTYFNDNKNSKNLKVDDRLLDKDQITGIVKDKIQAHEAKIASLEVLRKNISVEAKESLNKVLNDKCQ